MKETTIKITKKFKDWLTKKGGKNETYEDIIKRLIKRNSKLNCRGEKNEKCKQPTEKAT